MAYKEIGIKESNGDVRILTEVRKLPFLRMRSENMAKNRAIFRAIL